ncbi:hypothetical protein [Streptomyces lydicus]
MADIYPATEGFDAHHAGMPYGCATGPPGGLPGGLTPVLRVAYGPVTRA